MKKKLLTTLLAACAATCLCFGLSACGGGSNEVDNSGGNEQNIEQGGSSGNTGNEGSSSSGNTGNEGSGSSGSTGNEGSGSSGNTGNEGSGSSENTGNEGSGSSGSTGNEGSGSSGSTGNEGSGSSGDTGDTGDTEAYGLLTLTLSGDGTYYSVSDCDPSATEVTIPSTHNAKPVKNIGDEAFSSCTSLQSINIPDGVTSIGIYAFYGCSSLQSVTIGTGVTSIGMYAFQHCRALTEINYNATECADLSSSNYVFAYAGQDGDGITVNIGANVKNIPAYLFSPFISNSQYSPKIVGVIFSGNSQCKSIGNQAFALCTSLTSITIPNSVTSIGDYAFRWCAFTSMTIPNSVTSIGDYAFGECNSLTSITIPDSVTSIGSKAFVWCTSLTSIEIPSSVTSIGAMAFAECTKLTSITLPFVGGSVKTSSDTYQYPFGYIFGTGAGTGLTGVQQYYYGSDTSSRTSDYYYIPTKLKSVTITGGNILYGAFIDCSMLTNITLGDSVTSIGQSAFNGCTNLSSVTIGSGVTSIGYYAFRNCTSLASITIPDSVTSIEQYAFSKCTSLKSVTFENKIGWSVYKTSTATSGTSISKTDLNDTYTAATRLTSESSYLAYYWKRSES